MSKISQELLSQPECWRASARLADVSSGLLPRPGARVAAAGCGSSFYVARAIAAWREAAGHGETDAFAASEMPLTRDYDLVVVISRSGTTTEVLRLATAVPGRMLAITTTADSPLTTLAESIVLDFADEQSVVQTRSATSVLALFRAHLGHDVQALAENAQQSISADLPANIGAYEQFVFLGRGAAAGLASEAALKFRETAQAWSEAYPSMEFRHGPISVIGERSLVWSLDALEPSLTAEIAGTGATVVPAAVADPMAELVRVHRAAVAFATGRGLDPANPRRLARSVVLK